MITMILRSGMVLFFSLLLASQVWCETVTVVSTFGPGMTFDSTRGNWVGNDNYIGNQIVAQQFTPTETVQFSTAMLAMREWVEGVEHTVHVFLMTDQAGVPGAVLEQINVALSSPLATNVVTATSALRPTLTSGTPYWLVASATRTVGLESAQVMWHSNSIGLPDDTPQSKLCQTYGGTCTITGPWTLTSPIVRTAFRIDGTTNPTPQYNVCPLYDQTKAAKSGSTIPIKVQLCAADGHNLSSSNLQLHATGVTHATTSTSGPVEDSGNANADDDFRFDASLGATGGYIFNLSTKGLSTGTYNLNFTVTGDSVPYTVAFQVK